MMAAIGALGQFTRRRRNWRSCKWNSWPAFRIELAHSAQRDPDAAHNLGGG